MPSPFGLKIGEVSERTGLSAKTLRHYDEIGLLTPSLRTESNYRLYTTEDLANLQQIVSLKGLGFTLEQIKEVIQKKNMSPLQIIEMQLGQVREQMQSSTKLLERLEGLTRFFHTKENVTADDLLEVIALMNKVNSYYSESELEEIHARGEAMGREEIVKVENEWPELIAKVKDAMEQRLDPKSAEVQKLAKRWKELVEMFTGGNPEIAAKLKKMYQENPQAQKQFMGGPHPGMMEYIDAALSEG